MKLRISDVARKVRLFALGGIALAGGAAYSADTVTPVIDGDTWTFTVASGTETYTSTISGAVKVVKEGAGILDLGSDVNTFTGGIEVNGGTLQGTLTALGGKVDVAASSRVAPHDLVRVAEGATLLIRDTSCDGNYQTALAKLLEVGGHGVGNAGAVQRPSGHGSSHWLFDNITLTADTTFYELHRWGFRGGTFDMGGHKLKIIGNTNYFELLGTVTVQNAGEIELAAGSFLIQGALTGDRGTITMDNGTTLGVWGQTSPVYWPINVLSNATIKAGDGSTRNKNVIAGDITFDTTLTMTLDASTRHATISGGLDGRGELVVNDVGTLYITGKVDRTVGKFTQSKGTVVLENAGKFSITNRTIGSQGFVPDTPPGTLAGAWTSVPRLTVTGDTLLAMPKSADGTAASTEKHHLMIGKGTDTFGILDIQAGAVVSNDLNVGRNTSSLGAVYVNGGKLFWRAGSQNQGWLGHSGTGYMLINPGSEFVSDGMITMGKTAGTGIVHQRGGTVRMTSNSYSLRLARENNSYAHWYQTGGSFTGAYDAMFCYQEAAWTHNNLEAVLTLSGAETTMTFNDGRYIKAYVSSNALTSVVNLNDGATLTVRKIFKTVPSGSQTNLFSNPVFVRNVANSKLYINFDGGILKPRQYGDFFYWSSATSYLNDDPDRITVHTGGAVIDTTLCSGGSTTWTVPLKKPSGNVLLSVSLPTDAAWTNKYIASPRVVISGVNQHGATAVAEFDEAAQRLTGITITSPGNDVPNDITVTIKSGDQKSTFSCPFTVGAPARDGGLTKRGAYLLDFTMSASNPHTYEGPTVVEEGELKYSYKTYPEASPLVLKGGTVTFGGNAYTLKSIEGYGTIAGSGGVTVTNELRISCADLFGENRSITAQKVTLGSGVKLVVTDPENLDSYKSAGQVTFLTATTSLSGDAPTPTLGPEYGGWLCIKSGNSLKFGIPSGTIISFK